MGKLHELLAIEKTAVGAAAKLIEESNDKFKKKEHYFQGLLRTLKMIKESPENAAVEVSAREEKALPTTVVETIAYTLDFWAKAEDIIFQKNKSNQRAVANIEINGKALVEDVPVDELMGLEVRLELLRRNLFEVMPTLDASKNWVTNDEFSSLAGSWVTKTPEVTAKTEKILYPVTLYEATKEHPAQVKEASKDEVVGTFTKILYSGALTSREKADMLAQIDELISAVKQARMRANSIEADTSKIGKMLVAFLLLPLQQE